MDKLFPELNDIDNRRIEDIGVAMKEIIRLRELLRRCKSVIDVCGVDWKHATSRLDPALFDELAEELGDE